MRRTIILLKQKHIYEKLKVKSYKLKLNLFEFNYNISCSLSTKIGFIKIAVFNLYYGR